MAEWTTNYEMGVPKGQNGQRVLFAFLSGLTWSEARAAVERHSDGAIPEIESAQEFVVGGDAQDAAARGKRRDRHDVWFHRLDGGVVVAGLTAAPVMTAVQVCRSERPTRAHAGRGVLTSNPRFFPNPGELENPHEADRGFVVDPHEEDALRIVYQSGVEANSEVRQLVDSGWFDTLASRSGAIERLASLSVGYTAEHGAGDAGSASTAAPASDEFCDLVRAALTKHQNVLLDGVAGSGKTHLREELAKYYPGEQMEFAVFHPSTSYEDFVRGMRPNFAKRAAGADGATDNEFVIADGLFVDICNRAWESAVNLEGDGHGLPFLLFIDEINRANTARVLGDLLYAIEGSKRVVPGADGAQRAVSSDNLHGSVRLQVWDEEHPQYLRVPSNLHILGTMNSTDRSVGTLDLALQRRFHRVGAEPFTRDELVQALDAHGLEAALQAELVPVFEWYGELNSRLNRRVGPDARVGHAYFFKNLPRSSDGVGRYRNGVVTEILAQVAEIMRSFVVDERTLTEVMDGLEYTVRMEGEGLGATPVIELPTTVESTPATPVTDWPHPSDDVRANLHAAMTEHGEGGNLRLVFDVAGSVPNALVDSGSGMPMGHNEVATAVQAQLVESGASTRGTTPGNTVRHYESLMWGRPANGVAKGLAGAIRKQFLSDRSEWLSADALQHLEAVQAACKVYVDGRGLTADATAEDTVAELLHRRKNVLVEGVAGSGKSHMLAELAQKYGGNVEFVVFHPSTTYEDFVRGVRPVTAGAADGREFEIADGVFLEVCMQAWESALGDEPQEFLLFIDEINRANTARVLGDLLCVIEDSKRVDPSEPGTPQPDSCLTSTQQPNSVRLLVSDDEHPAHLRVPSNLHILGTMNSTDRSVGSLDLALQRRFGRVFQAPKTAAELTAALEADSDSELTDELVALIDWYGSLNQRLRDRVGPDAQIGHSYFFGRPSVEDVSEQIFAQLGEIARVFACEEKLGDLTPATGDDAHPLGWHLVVRGERLGRMPVLEKTPPVAATEPDESPIEPDEQ